MARPRQEGLDYFPMDTDFRGATGRCWRRGRTRWRWGCICGCCAAFTAGETGYACAWGAGKGAAGRADAGTAGGAAREQAAVACARAGLFDEELLRRGLLTSRDIQRRYFSAVGNRLLKRLSRDGEIRLSGDGLLLDGAEIAELLCGESRRPCRWCCAARTGAFCLRLMPQRRENQSHRKTETKQEINQRQRQRKSRTVRPCGGGGCAVRACSVCPCGVCPCGPPLRVRACGVCP